MKTLLTLALAACAVATDHGSSYGGSGPYKSYYFEAESLPNHTFYQPLKSSLKDFGSELKLPVIIWGNGGCEPCTHHFYQNHTNYIDGLKFRNFLGEVTSWGALAIATGAAFTDPEAYTEGSDPSSVATDQDPGALTDAIDWVFANAGKGAWQHIDHTRIGVWGQSCGGLEAYSAGAHDDRVSHLGIFNSGQLAANESKSVAGSITKPVFYVLGGPGDVAYPNGGRDYGFLPNTTSAWKGSHTLGHSEAFDVEYAGIPGVTGRKILQWILRGDASAKQWFIGDAPHQAGYVNVTYQNLDRVHVQPL